MTDSKHSAGAADDPADELSYEEARDELVAVVQRLEAGGMTLQESIAAWERGERLAAICQRWLDGARARLDAVMTEASDESGGKTTG
jgi:exodeoxyribonuclease VII small subunit